MRLIYSDNKEIKECAEIVGGQYVHTHYPINTEKLRQKNGFSVAIKDSVRMTTAVCTSLAMCFKWDV